LAGFAFIDVEEVMIGLTVFGVLLAAAEGGGLT
jgi:hypothetical protein